MNVNYDLLNGKNIIITGATRGIGKGIAELFSKYGANIAFTYISSEKSAQEIESMLSTSKNKIKAYKLNASSYEKTELFINEVVKEFGSIDVVINNAGITKDNLLMRMSEEDFDDVININLKSVFNITKSVQRTLIKQRKGSIINISSIVGVQGNAGQANYAASKAGVIGFSKSIARELGPRNIRVNVIAPGFIETEMTAKLNEEVIKQWRNSIPLKRGGTPKDVANACLFLASDLSCYITGQVLLVDGGMVT